MYSAGLGTRGLGARLVNSVQCRPGCEGPGCEASQQCTVQWECQNSSLKRSTLLPPPPPPLPLHGL